MLSVIHILAETSGSRITSAYWGPGSEWFWAFLQLALLSIGVIFTLRQLSLNRQANMISLMKNIDDRWMSDRMTIARCRVCQARDNGAVSVSNEEDDVLVFFEDLGFYFKRGICDRPMIWEAYSIYVEFYWPMLQHKVTEQWAKGDKTFYSNFKTLYDHICRISKKKGARTEKTKEEIDGFTQSEIDRIKRLQADGLTGRQYQSTNADSAGSRSLSPLSSSEDVSA